MTTYIIIVFLVVSCVAQKDDNSNIGTSGVLGKDVSIGMPKNSDSLKKFDENGGDVLNKKNEERSDDRVKYGGYFDNFGKDVRNNNYNKPDEKEYKLEFDEGNPDIHEKIERPCEVYDTSCIRRFFEQHSNCKITGGPVPDPFFRAQGTVNYPRVQISVTQTNAEYRGLSNARVEEFYINKATDNVIITLEFDAVTNFSNNTYLQFYLRGREPIVTRDFAGLVYEKLSITVIIPQLNDLRLDKAEIYTYASVPVYPFVTGPRVAETKDPEALANFAAFVLDLSLNEQEALLTEGNFYAATYIQYNICDFGLKVL